MKKFSIVLIGLTLLGVFVFAAGTAEEGVKPATVFPSKEVRIVVPYNPGGQSDVMARKIGSIIETRKLFDKPVIITNIAGAGTRDGLRAVYEAVPDGHTVLFHHSAMLTLKSMDLIPWGFEDFTVLAQVAQAPMVVVTRSQSPYNSIDDLIKAARAKPGELLVAIQGGLGSNAHFITEMIMDNAKVNFRRVAYPGGAEARAAILGGHVTWYVTSLAESIPYVRSGDFKILGITSETRVPGLEDIPTLVEQGYDIVFNIHSSIFGPKNLPEDIKTRWEEVLKTVVADPEYQAFMNDIFTQPRYLNSKDAVVAYEEQWKRILPISEIVKKAAIN